MGKQRSWTDGQLVEAVKVSKSYRNVLILLRLVPAGGNYEQVKLRVRILELDTTHFTGMGWNVGMNFRPKDPAPIETLLVRDSSYQSFSLKKRLFAEGFKEPKCELCNWAERSEDGSYSS